MNKKWLIRDKTTQWNSHWGRSLQNFIFRVLWLRKNEQKINIIFQLLNPHFLRASFPFPGWLSAIFDGCVIKCLQVIQAQKCLWDGSATDSDYVIFYDSHSIKGSSFIRHINRESSSAISATELINRLINISITPRTLKKSTQIEIKR